MAFLETRTDRIVLSGVGRVEVTLSEGVKAGDCLGDSSATWVLSAHASGEAPVLVAGVNGLSGEIIVAYMMAVLQVTTTASNKATQGEVVALKDTGEYQAAGGGLPDVGCVASVGSDSLSAIIFVCPMMQLMDTARS